MSTHKKSSQHIHTAHKGNQTYYSHKYAQMASIHLSFCNKSATAKLILLTTLPEKVAFVRTDTQVMPLPLAHFFFYFFQLPQSHTESKDRNVVLLLTVCYKRLTILCLQILFKAFFSPWFTTALFPVWLGFFPPVQKLLLLLKPLPPPWFVSVPFLSI